MLRRSLTFLTFLTLSSVAFADSVAWEVTGQNNFGVADLTTGSFNTVSNLGFTAAGLGEIGNTVYAANSGGTGLYSVNTNTGTTTWVGNSSISYYAFGSTNSGLYMVDTTGSLWNIDPSTGSSTRIGSTHLDMTTSPYTGLSAGSNNLYIALGSNIYTINTSTGAASYVGVSSGTDFGALVDVSGTVYGASVVSPNEIYTFNPSTGTSAFVSASMAGDYAYGLAPIVPEPATFGLLGLAGSLFGAYAWRRKRV